MYARDTHLVSLFVADSTEDCTISTAGSQRPPRIQEVSSHLGRIGKLQGRGISRETSQLSVDPIQPMPDRLVSGGTAFMFKTA